MPNAKAWTSPATANGPGRWIEGRAKSRASIPAKAGISGSRGSLESLGLHHDQQAARRAYVGMTTDLRSRARHHRAGHGSVFTRKYNCHRLVHFEQFDTVLDAKAREKAMKEWKRAWKIELIENWNPEWADLIDRIT